MQGLHALLSLDFQQLCRVFGRVFLETMQDGIVERAILSSLVIVPHFEIRFGSCRAGVFLIRREACEKASHG